MTCQTCLGRFFVDVSLETHLKKGMIIFDEILYFKYKNGNYNSKEPVTVQNVFGGFETCCIYSTDYIHFHNEICHHLFCYDRKPYLCVL